jgi:hypothetical protein
VPVNPDDLLIFKMRGMGPKPKKEKAVKEKKPKERLEIPSAMPEEAIPEAAQPVPPPTEAAITATATFSSVEKELTPEESQRLYGYSPLEQRAPKAGAPTFAAERRRTSINVFAYITGILFIVNALVFGYFTYPQAVFLGNRAVEIGLLSFIRTLNYDYITSLVNIVLALLSMIGGVVIVTRPKMGHLTGGIVNSLVILAVTFEYLNSTTNYLLLVNGIAFLSIIFLAYARMSSAAAIEAEEENFEEFRWPTMEAF